ncbi:oxygenase MpaB family protein [Blastococcus sp. Marseille-P5729]|uniref:oxygenase MpaB family protein n=1 Tax=Blastococcus sp. Marseille-P5729 TaxID=2086582 RepID=UPI000D10D991|nr:oxygenase MpaB family protein [Blastococcus sp. Marseille-P5729]
MIQRLRNELRDAVRSRVAGEDAEARAQEIWAKPGARAFTESDPIWRVHSDASMFAGGIRALLLQALHPLAMAGVAQHSGYRSDPLGRLQRTSDFIAQTTFAVREDADRAIRIVKAVHKRVVGTAPDGREYSASDPHLLLWVHVAEIGSFLVTHQRFGAVPLTGDEADQYVAQTAATAEALGVVRAPRSVRELNQVLDSYRPELCSTPESVDVARFLLLKPPVPLVARGGYAGLALAAAATLPPWALSMLRIPRLPVLTPVVGGLAGGLAVSTVRWIMTAQPRPRPRQDA